MNTNKQLAACMIFQVIFYTALCEILYRHMNKEKILDSRNSVIVTFWGGFFGRGLYVSHKQYQYHMSANAITMSLMKAADVIYTATH